MSRINKQKHIMKESLSDYFDPPTEKQQITRVVKCRGNNLHEVESADPEITTTFLVSMPTKFRKNIWIRRGAFVVIESIDEGDKVKGEIVRILAADQIKEFTKDGIWPEKFVTKKNQTPDESIKPITTKTTKTTENNSDNDDDDDDEETDEDDDSDLVANPNRRHEIDYETSSSSEEDDEIEENDKRK